VVGARKRFIWKAYKPKKMAVTNKDHVREFKYKKGLYREGKEEQEEWAGKN
jgi:hypothetical protein